MTSIRKIKKRITWNEDKTIGGGRLISYKPAKNTSRVVVNNPISELIPMTEKDVVLPEPVGDILILYDYGF